MEEPAQDLIEERKPTSLLVAQFFLFPLIIIAICVGIFLLFGYLTYEQRSPREFLKIIQSGSDQRWQAAYELSSHLSSNKEKLDPDLLDEMFAAYQNSKGGDVRVRRYLAVAIGRAGDKRAVPLLLEGLEDSDVENQIYTLSALGFIGDNSAVPGVIKQLKHPDPAVRKVAAYVLGAMKDPSAAHDLQIALNDVKDEVRWNAAIALARMGDPAGAEILVRLLDRGYVDSLPDMTAEQKAELMVNAVKCLAILKFDQARGKIIELSKGDSSLAVRNASLEALKKF